MLHFFFLTHDNFYTKKHFCVIFFFYYGFEKQQGILNYFAWNYLHR